MVRFFAAQTDISGGLIRLSDVDAAHIRSLRLRPDELFTVCDGEGSDHVCRLRDRDQGSGDRDQGARGQGTWAEIVETRPSLGEPSVSCTVYIALAKGERLDYAVQKSVELGAHEIVLFPSARSVAVPGDMSKKTARLQRIALETAKQCGRGRVPNVASVSSFETAISSATGCDAVNAECRMQNAGSSNDGEANAGILPLFFYECEEQVHLKQVLEGQTDEPSPCLMLPPKEAEPPSPCFPAVAIVTGPEGGFEPFEAALARSAGMIAVSLGPRILRCETAPVVALAAVMYHTGNL